MTLLREIQTEVSTSGGDLATILRKCKILAARLGSAEFARWVTWELDGYPEDQPIPSYRRLAAQYYANFMGVGWNAEPPSQRNSAGSLAASNTCYLLIYQ